MDFLIPAPSWMAYFSHHLSNTNELSHQCTGLVSSHQIKIWCVRDGGQKILSSSDGGQNSLSSYYCISNAQCKAMMRSVLVILRPLRGHHGQYFEYCKQPEANIRYLLQWAKPSHWFQALMLPTLQAAVLHARPIREAGLDKNCSVGFPLFGPPEGMN